MSVEIKIETKENKIEIKQENKKSQENTEFELGPDGKLHPVLAEPNVKIEIIEE